MLDYEKIGRKIKNERKIRGLTQEKLAEKIDVCVPYVGLIENGKRIQSLETMVKICRALKIRIDRVLE